MRAAGSGHLPNRIQHQGPLGPTREYGVIRCCCLLRNTNMLCPFFLLPGSLRIRIRFVPSSLLPGSLRIRIRIVPSSFCRARFGFEYASFLLLTVGHASDSNTLRSFFLLPGSLRIRIRFVLLSSCCRASLGFEYASLLLSTIRSCALCFLTGF